MKNLLRALILIVTICGIGTIGFVAVAQRYPGIIWLMDDLAYVSPYCPGWRVVLDSNVQVEQLYETDRISNESSVIATTDARDLWDTPQGRFWIPSGNPDILPILLAQQEREIYGDAEWGVQPGDVVLDCGAHVGVYARTALSKGASLVVAIEPSPRALECLRRNLSDEIESGRVIVYPKGVWDSETELTFFQNADGAAGDSFVQRAEDANVVEKIAVNTISRIAEELRLERVDLIKMDVKGATQRAIHGAAAVIRAHQPRLVLSTEEAGDEPLSITSLVQSINPQYHLKTGPCIAHDSSVFTDVLFLRSDNW